MGKTDLWCTFGPFSHFAGRRLSSGVALLAARFPHGGRPAGHIGEEAHKRGDAARARDGDLDKSKSTNGDRLHLHTNSHANALHLSGKLEGERLNRWHEHLQASLFS